MSIDGSTEVFDLVGFPAWSGIRPPFRRVFLFYGKKIRRTSVSLTDLNMLHRDERPKTSQESPLNTVQHNAVNNLAQFALTFR